MTKKKSQRKLLEDRIKALIRKKLKKERGSRCEFCGRYQTNISLFHILGEGAHPRLKFYIPNLMLACWYPAYWAKLCHNEWHRNPEAKERMKKQIAKKYGKDYREKLLIAEKTMPRLTMSYLKTLEMALKLELKNAKNV